MIAPWLRAALGTCCCVAIAATVTACSPLRSPSRVHGTHGRDDGDRAVDGSTGLQRRPLRCVQRLGSMEPGPEPAALVPVVAHRKKAWEASFGGEVAARPHVRARLAGWPEVLLAQRASLPKDDEEFLWRVARDTWRGLSTFVDRPSGLPIDNVRFEPTSSATPAGGPSATAGAEDRQLAVTDASAASAVPEGRVGDYASATDIGLWLTAIVAARDLGFISQAETIATAGKVLATLDDLERYEGFFFNFYDTTSLERTSNFISFVDAAWLFAGLLAVRSAVPELADKATRFIEEQDFRLFYDAKLGLIWHGFWVHVHRPSIFHYGVLYSEARLGALMAIGKGDMPQST